MEEYTPADKWLGDYERAGQRVRGLETLREMLAPDFDFVRSVDLPFLIREHARKFQWSVSLAGDVASGGTLVRTMVQQVGERLAAQSARRRRQCRGPFSRRRVAATPRERSAC